MLPKTKHGITARESTPLRGGYLAPYAAVGYALGLIDWILGLFVARESRTSISGKEIKKILLSNTAHLGDVLIASSVLTTIKAHFPAAEIGIVVGSWAVSLVKDIPGVNYVHVVDHWKLNRDSGSRTNKILRYIETRRNALKEIRAIHYDVAIDLYLYFPNSAVLFWQAEISNRIGFRTGGFGNLYTHPLEWELDEKHVVHQYVNALSLLGIDPEWVMSARPFIEFNTESEQAQLEAKRKPYRVVVHLGAGDMKKSWQLAKWRELIVALLATEKIEIYCSGASTSETLAIDEVIDGLDFCTNLSQKQLWQQFVILIASADLLVGVDSVAGHVASAVKTPCVIVAAAMGNLNHWRPLGRDAHVLTHTIHCAPCYNGNGCPEMACVRNVQVADVLRASFAKLDMNSEEMEHR